MKSDTEDLFLKLKDQLLNIDPVYWTEKYLTIDGKPFRLNGNGYRPFVDIYRHIGIKALEPNAKPVVMVKARQISGSTMACALEMYFMGSGIFGNGDRFPIRVMHSFPQLELAAAYSKTKLNAMINSSIPINDGNKNKPKSIMQSLLDQSSDTNDSLHFKQFKGGNHLWIESIGLDGDRVMGRTADVIFYDEVQKTTGAAIGNSLKILTTAKYGEPGKGVRVFFGTPRKKGSDFYKMWQTSSQQYFHLNCEKCHEYFPLYTPESDDWKKIWIHGFIIKCPRCGFEQNKLEATERGKWVATRDANDPDCQMIGFHINQLYMPTFTRETIDGEMPGRHPVNTERTYQNEVMGEFYQGDSSPITPEEIREICGENRPFRAMIEASKDQIVVLGVDYGARSDIEQLANPEKVKNVGQSYSTAVVLLIKGPELFSIEFATKFKRNDMESKKGIIDQLMRQYSVNLAVGDIGFSEDFSKVMHEIYGDRYLVSRAAGKLNDHIKFRSDAYPKEINFERNYYIAELFNLMKKGNVKFPLGSYEKVAWLIEHCASMEISPSISKFGEHTLNYVKGSTPNDGFMALLNAYLAYKFLITKGFTNNNPLLQQKSFGLVNKPLVMTGNISRRF